MNGHDDALRRAGQPRRPGPPPTRIRQSPRRRAGPSSLLPILAALALVLAACQSGQGSGSPTGAGLDLASASPTVSMAASGPPDASAAASPSDSANGTSVGLESTFIDVVERVSPSVVVVATDQGLGSGIVFDDQGNIVTNAHVVGDATSFQILTPEGDQLQGSLVGTFVSGDLAVVHADGLSAPAATFGDSSALQRGEIVLAIGNPLGLQSSVTDGIVSALGRTVNEPNGAALPGVIQTSASINPGNSGGALVNLDAEVIGIPTLSASDPQIGGAAPGIGFAVPSNTVTDIAGQLIDHGEVIDSHRAYLGIEAADVRNAEGVLIFAVEPGGPADSAGIESDVLLTAIGGHPVTSQASLAAVLADLDPGQTVDVELTHRDGSTETVSVTLGELPG